MSWSGRARADPLGYGFSAFALGAQDQVHAVQDRHADCERLRVLTSWERPDQLCGSLSL